MPLIDVLRKGVAIADGVTKSLHCDVTNERYIGDDGEGGRIYASPVTLKAIVDWKAAQVRTQTGVLSVSRALVMFLDIKALLAATNSQGVNDDDRITLQDGTTGPILDLRGFIDPGTSIPLATEVFLG